MKSPLFSEISPRLTTTIVHSYLNASIMARYDCCHESDVVDLVLSDWSMSLCIESFLAPQSAKRYTVSNASASS